MIVYIYDHIGEGGTAFNDEVRVTVRKDGLFEGAIHPRSPLKFRTNMVCSVVFGPTYPAQPMSVVKIVGAKGQHLGVRETNPQIQDAPAETLLVDDTTVRQ